MNARRNRVLLLEADQDVLLDLQKRLEDAGFDTTITWDISEAIQLARGRHFDLMLIGEHPPALVAAEVLHDLQCQRIPVRCAVMQTGKTVFDPDYFYSLGAQGTLPAWAMEDVADWVQEWLAPRRSAAAV